MSTGILLDPTYTSKAAFGSGTEQQREQIHSNTNPDFLCEVSMGTGILLDPTYTGKAAFGFVQELKKNENRFTGTRILFLHACGMFGLFDGRMEPVLTKSDKSGNKIKMWLNKNSCPE